MRTAEAVRRSAGSAIRIRPVPIVDPPYDDELVGGDAWMPGQLALSWTAGDDDASAADRPARALSGPAQPCGLPAGRGSAGTVVSDLAARTSGRARAGAARLDGRTAPAHVPPVVAGASVEARRSVHRFVGAFTEVVNGYRPASHLRQLAHPGDAPVIVAQARAAGDRIAEWRRAAPGAGGAAGRSAARSAARHGRGFAPVAVLKLRLCEPRPGAVEATVLLVVGGRTWALALRLECCQGTWAATVARLL
jgi:hypothetical protein